MLLLFFTPFRCFAHVTFRFSSPPIISFDVCCCSSFSFLIIFAIPIAAADTPHAAHYIAVAMPLRHATSSPCHAFSRRFIIGYACLMITPDYDAVDELPRRQ